MINNDNDLLSCLKKKKKKNLFSFWVENLGVLFSYQEHDENNDFREFETVIITIVDVTIFNEQAHNFP